MNSKEGITAIIVAVIGLCSALGVAIIYNWNPFQLPAPTYTPTDTQATMSPSTPTDTPTSTPMDEPTSTPTDTQASTPTDTPTSTSTDTPAVPPSRSVPVTYKVTVRTRDYSWAGTDASVYLSIYGTMATPLLDQFLNTPGYNDFERGDVNYFYITSPQNLGDIEHIEIWHDNSGSSAGWYLDYVIITNQTTGTSWNFPCQQWLSGENGLMRTIYPNGPCQ